MAQYKVPQDVEADDKLLGPFSFRQFVYIMIAGGLGVLAFFLFQIFPLLIIIPIPFIIFLIILALPLKKDQPMETYLSAIVDFYLKPHKRVWMPGQVETSITITAPKKTEENRTKDLSQEEAGRRLSFLADIVDTEGYAIKESASSSNLRDDIASEAAATQDIFETSQTYNLDRSLQQSTDDRHAQLLAQMRSAIAQQPAAPAPAAPDIEHSSATIQPDLGEIHDVLASPSEKEQLASSYATEPTAPPIPEPEHNVEPEPVPEPEPEPTPEPAPTNPALENLANNPDFSVETIAHQAKRIEEQQSNDQEVYISLH